MAIAGVTRGGDFTASVAVGLTPKAAQLGLLAVVCCAVVGGVFATGAGAEAHAVGLAGPDLTRLLRAMAAIKVLMAGGALAAVLWRLQSAVSAGRFGLYAVAAAGMGAGPVLIWGMVHVALGAFFLHAGLIACVVLLWRDPEVSARLAVLVATRRR